MTLKGSREATNISYAPKETQVLYGEASSLVGSIDNFYRKVGKENVEFTCGIYCKKVVVKDKKDKKEDKNLLERKPHVTMGLFFYLKLISLDKL